MPSGYVAAATHSASVDAVVSADYHQRNAAKPTSIHKCCTGRTLWLGRAATTLRAATRHDDTRMQLLTTRPSDPLGAGRLSESSLPRSSRRVVIRPNVPHIEHTLRGTQVRLLRYLEVPLGRSWCSQRPHTSGQASSARRVPPSETTADPPRPPQADPPTPPPDPTPGPQGPTQLKATVAER